MQYEAMRFWLEAALLIGGPAFTYWRTREKVTSSHIVALDKRIAGVETDKKLADGRYLAIEKKLEEIVKDVKHHADCKYHQGFEARLDKMNGSINKLEGTVTGRLEGIGSALDLIQQHLLNNGGK